MASANRVRAGLTVLVLAAGVPAFAGAAWGADVFASAAPVPGQNGLYRINPTTGATSLVASMPLVAGLAGTPDGRLLGWTNGALVEVSTVDGTLTPVGVGAGVSATGFEVLSDGRAFIVGSPQTSAAQLFEVNLTDGTLTPVGGAGAINAGIDSSLGLPEGTSRANIFALGSVGTEPYGINAESGRTNLVRIDTTTGQAVVIGAANALVNANGGGWSGFASLTGADTNGDGVSDALIAGVNFRSSARQGVVARIDTVTGEWTQLAANPPLIFFGMGAPGTPACDSVDFNNDGVFPDDADLADFVLVLGGGACAACNDVDFNNDGVFPDDSDLQTFLFVLGGGSC